MKPARWFAPVLLSCALVPALLGTLWPGAAQAAALGQLTRHTFTDYCSTHHSLDAAAQDRLLRFAAVVRRELQTSGQPMAIVSRSGTDLRRFGQRFSHAGLALREGAELPWAVRQLYYACDEQRPRLFDQGLAGFVLGSDDPSTGHVSIVLLPEGPEADALQRAALDKPAALGLLAPSYRANAYAFSSRYQNCNQWLVEMIALAWMDDRTAAQGLEARQRAQRWLQEAGYVPQRMLIGSRLLMWAASVVPLLTLDDHPPEDRDQLQMQITMPSAIEAFVRQRLPAAQRLEICHAQGRVVIRRGWEPVAEGCVPNPTDVVEALD